MVRSINGCGQPEVFSLFSPCHFTLHLLPLHGCSLRKPLAPRVQTEERVFNYIFKCRKSGLNLLVQQKVEKLLRCLEMWSDLSLLCFSVQTKHKYCKNMNSVQQQHEPSSRVSIWVAIPSDLVGRFRLGLVRGAVSSSTPKCSSRHFTFHWKYVCFE